MLARLQSDAQNSIEFFFLIRIFFLSLFDAFWTEERLGTDCFFHHILQFSPKQSIVLLMIMHKT